ncbi:MAG: hypothetical protein U0Q16_38020 [Bryobacteraceae bacterium]
MHSEAKGNTLSRRDLFAAPAFAASALAAPPARGFLFRARGSAGFLGGGEKTAFLRADGSALRVYDFGRPTHMGWGPYAFFRDGRALLLSIEMTDDWKTKPFQVYYPNSRTHLWICDLRSGKLTEIAHKERIAPFYQPAALLPSEDRLLVTVSIQGKEVLYSMDLDGAHARRLTDPGEYVYGIAASPDGRRLAFHANYRIATMNTDGGGRVEVAGERGQLHFGPQWSPDGQWLCWQVCEPKTDPGHDWSDLWIGRPGGGDNRRLTNGMSLWFAASYGKPDNPGGGSNVPKWSPDGTEIVFARRSAGAKPPWEFQNARPDTTHFNRDFKPESAHGGTQLCAIESRSSRIRELTPATEGTWDFRGEWSPDGKQLLFCRAGIGENPAICVILGDGSAAKMLTRGIDGQGADHPRWLPRG